MTERWDGPITNPYPYERLRVVSMATGQERVVIVDGQADHGAMNPPTGIYVTDFKPTTAGQAAALARADHPAWVHKLIHYKSVEADYRLYRWVPEPKVLASWIEFTIGAHVRLRSGREFVRTRFGWVYINTQWQEWGTFHQGGTTTPMWKMKDESNLFPTLLTTLQLAELCEDKLPDYYYASPWDDDWERVVDRGLEEGGW